MQNHVSFALIVRNEEACLPGCLQSIAPIAGEIIVVDTGSTDRTKDIATSFGAKVFEFPWCDDFAAGRNECIRHATGEWIFWMDADERVDEVNREKLRVLFESIEGMQEEINHGTHVFRVFRGEKGCGQSGFRHEMLVRAAGGGAGRDGGGSRAAVSESCRASLALPWRATYQNGLRAFEERLKR